MSINRASIIFTIMIMISRIIMFMFMVKIVSIVMTIMIIVSSVVGLHGYVVS